MQRIQADTVLWAYGLVPSLTRILFLALASSSFSILRSSRLRFSLRSSSLRLASSNSLPDRMRSFSLSLSSSASSFCNTRRDQGISDQTQVWSFLCLPKKWVLVSGTSLALHLLYCTRLARAPLATCNCGKPGNRPDEILLFCRNIGSCASFHRWSRTGAGLLWYRHFVQVDKAWCWPVRTTGKKRFIQCWLFSCRTRLFSFGSSATVLGLAYVPHAFHKFSQQVCSFKFDHSS